MPTIDAHYLLAGGRSRRFGSDKARAQVHGKPLIRRVAERLWPELPLEWVVVVADEPHRYADLSLRTIADPAPHQGPMQGLATALSHYLTHGGTGWVLLSACDLTQPSPDWVSPLCEAQTVSGSRQSVAYVDADGRWQPLPSLHHVDALPALRAALAAGERSLCRWLDQADAHAIKLPKGNNTVPSANTPDELQRRV